MATADDCRGLERAGWVVGESGPHRTGGLGRSVSGKRAAACIRICARERDEAWPRAEAPGLLPPG
jgi:hypothetical protein